MLKRKLSLIHMKNKCVYVIIKSLLGRIKIESMTSEYLCSRECFRFCPYTALAGHEDEAKRSPNGMAGGGNKIAGNLVDRDSRSGYKQK